MDTIKTVIHEYFFNTRNKEEAEAYKELEAKLTAMGLKCFNSHGGASHYNPKLNGLTLELETKHLFNNQWNTAPIPNVSEKGLRVFDWAQDAGGSDRGQEWGAGSHIKKGHWLEQTPEIKALRDNRMACGYCGHQEQAQKGNVFCPNCIDSEYLESKQLFLTRMKPVSDTKDRAPLTEAESAYLLPLYKQAQITGVTARGVARIAKEREDIEKTYKKDMHNTQVEHDGKLWLLDHGIHASVIYYNHTGRFGFGWRANGLDKEIVSELLDAITEFPYPYDIKCADGTTLSGG